MPEPITPSFARAIALNELRKVLENHCLPAQSNLPVSLVGNPLMLAERLTAAAMAAHVAAGIKWPVITDGPLVESLKEQCVRCKAPLARDSGSRLCVDCYHDPDCRNAEPEPKHPGGPNA